MAVESLDGVVAPGGQEIAFFDVETTVPVRTGQGFALLEFGAILVCPRKLEEKWSFSTLVRPVDLSLISSLSVRCNGITRDLVLAAPPFADIADNVYRILHGRIWAGHNIARFDCARIREAFGEIGRPPPEPKGIIDSLAILSQKFGRRAGDMKMATLATYFGLGKQTHRSLDDVRMNLEVLKYCATVLFLESSLPEAFPDKSWISPNAVTRSRKNGKSSPESADSSADQPSCSKSFPVEITDGSAAHPILSLATTERIEDPFDMRSLGDEMNTETFQQDVAVEENESTDSNFSEAPSSLAPEEVSMDSITASLQPNLRGFQKLVLLHKNSLLQLHCRRVKVRFGLKKFVNDACRPKLSFVANAPPPLCRVLDACDEAARRTYLETGGTSDWRNVVSRKDGFINFPSIRLNVPTSMNEHGVEMYQKDESGAIRRCNADAYDGLIVAGIFLDVDFSLDFYDYQQTAGIRLVAKKIVLDLN